MRRSASAREGRRLAVQLLFEMRELGADQCVVDCGNRDGAPQSDVLARYLALVDAADDAKCGFLAVLTDFIGSAIDGSVATPEDMERLIAARFE